MKLIQVLFTLIIISGCKPNNSQLASTNSGQTNKRAAHSFCRSPNQIRLGSNNISQAKSDLMVLLSLGNNVQQGWSLGREAKQRHIVIWTKFENRPPAAFLSSLFIHGFVSMNILPVFLLSAKYS
jgi:hypothetical protein